MIEQREAKRYLLRWRVAIVHQNSSGKEEIFHGRTRDISTSGMAVCSDHNIFTESPVTIFLAIPPLHPGGKQEILEIKSKMAYTVHASGGHGFRIGVQFLRFKGNDKKILTDHLGQRLPSVAP